MNVQLGAKLQDSPPLKNSLKLNWIIVALAIAVASCESRSVVDHLACTWSVAGLEERQPGYFGAIFDPEKDEGLISVMFQNSEFGSQIGTIISDESVAVSDSVFLRKRVVRDDSGPRNVDLIVMERDGFEGYVSIAGGDFPDVLLSCE